MRPLIAAWLALLACLLATGSATAAPAGISVSGNRLVDADESTASLARLAVPRLEPLSQANTAYARHDLHTALELYEQAADTPPSDAESRPVAAAIDGLARFPALIALASIGQEDSARRQLALLVDSDPGAPLARLAAQFWDQYGMTASVRAACAQLAPEVESQAATVLATLASLGVAIRHDELCVAA